MSINRFIRMSLAAVSAYIAGAIWGTSARHTFFRLSSL
jgi:hypothetical protein